MSKIKLFLEQTLREQYSKALTLYECKTDPENEPYKSKYEAREILLELLKNLTIFKSENQYIESVNDQLELVSTIISVINYYIGCICNDCEEITDGKKYLLDSLQMIEKYPSTATIQLQVLNNLGILSSTLGDKENAMLYLVKGEETYNKYYLINTNAPKTCDDYIFDPAHSEQNKELSKKTFEENFTLNLYYQAQVINYFYLSYIYIKLIILNYTSISTCQNLSIIHYYLITNLK